VAGEAMERSNTRGRIKKVMASLEWGVLWMLFLMKNRSFDLSSNVVKRVAGEGLREAAMEMEAHGG
jgi:hypothetical protein